MRDTEFSTLWTASATGNQHQPTSTSATAPWIQADGAIGPIVEPGDELSRRSGRWVSIEADFTTDRRPGRYGIVSTSAGEYGRQRDWDEAMRIGRSTVSNVEIGRTADYGTDPNPRRPVEVEPYLRGVAWPAGAGAVYPRADPADIGRLPADTWSTAMLPVGVRLEVAGDAAELDVHYLTATDDLGYRGAGAGTTFSVWRGRVQVDERPAVLGRGLVRLDLGAGIGSADGRAIIYLPEGMKPSITAIEGVGGSIEPAAGQRRWLAYGDSIAEGWIASGPAGGWPAVAGRANGLDVVNLGYAGSARGELVSAEHLASLEADVISISHGTNCWTRIPHSTQQMTANTLAFLTVVRAGHPGVPIVVGSPVVRPDGEDAPNKLGATHGQIRRAMEDATLAFIDSGDGLVTLVPGAGLLDPGLLADGIHPGDEGHARLATVYGNAVATAVGAR